MNKIKWREERADNVKIGDVMGLIDPKNRAKFVDLIVTNVTVSNGQIHVSGVQNGKQTSVNPLNMTFVVAVRREDYYPAYIVDATRNHYSLEPEAKAGDVIRCLSSGNGFTVDREYRVQADVYDKFVIDDRGMERSLAQRSDIDFIIV